MANTERVAKALYQEANDRGWARLGREYGHVSGVGSQRLQVLDVVG